MWTSPRTAPRTPAETPRCTFWPFPAAPAHTRPTRRRSHWEGPGKAAPEGEGSAQWSQFSSSGAQASEGARRRRGEDGHKDPCEGHRLTPHVWDEPKGAWSGSGGCPKEKGGGIKRDRRKEEGPGTVLMRGGASGRSGSQQAAGVLHQSAPSPSKAASVAVARGRKGRWDGRRCVRDVLTETSGQTNESARPASSPRRRSSTAAMAAPPSSGETPLVFGR